MYVLRCTAVSLVLHPLYPSVLCSLANSSPSPSPSFYYTSLVLMILKIQQQIRSTLSQFSFSRLHPLSLLFHSLFFFSLSLFLSNTGRVLSDKNSSLNKHTIQKLLSYRLTASVKRIVFILSLFLSSLSLYAFLIFPSFLSLLST